MTKPQDIQVVNLIRKAMANPDEWVVALDYVDAKGLATRRVISPIRVVGDRILALCLCREETRYFKTKQCSNLQLHPAADVLMPVPMRPVETQADPKTDA